MESAAVYVWFVPVFLSVLYPALPAGHHAERLGNVGVHACFKRLFAVSLKVISILEIL